MSDDEVSVRAKLHSPGRASGRFEVHRVPLAPGLECEPADASVVDVVLVHGLTGNPFATWGLTTDADGICRGWPADVGKRLAGRARLWTAGYPAPVFASGSSELSLEEQGRDALRGLVAAGLGQRKTIFVAHSLGGILVKAMLHVSSLADRDELIEGQVVRNTHGAVFVGTPHTGSDLTMARHAIPWLTKLVAGGLGGAVLTVLGGTAVAWTLAHVSLFGLDWPLTVGTLVAGICVPLAAFFISAVLLAPSGHVLLLDPGNVLLYDATRHYRGVVMRYQFATRAFFERRRTWKLFRVVPRSSADPGVTDCDPQPLDAGHIGMCKGGAAGPVAEGVEALVNEARRGVDSPVFARYVLDQGLGADDHRKVEPFVRSADGLWVKRFADVKGDRRESERILREHFRWRFGHVAPPGPIELRLAESSEFDIDVFVWCMWHERAVLRGQRKLRERTLAAMARWEREFLSPRPSLIPFYRPLRTLEHGLLLDLADLGGETERIKLRALVARARAQLDARCPNVRSPEGTEPRWALDGDGGTRRLLLRMEALLDAVEASHGYFAARPREPHEDMQRHREELSVWRAQHAAAMKRFTDTLKRPNSDVGGPAAT